MPEQQHLRVGLAQIAPVWLDRERTVRRVEAWVRKAGERNCDLVVFGETLIPGYPFWLEHTDGARFENNLQKSLFAHYIDQAVRLERGDLEPVQSTAREIGITVMIGCYECPADRGGHSGYCSLVTIDRSGVICNVHRKAMPTHEERLVWGIGDGHGLKTFEQNGFTIGGLNCWENWMPLLRSTLYAKGEDLHVAVWPGNRRNTVDITRFIAQEARSYVVSVSGLLSRAGIPDEVPHAQLLRESCPETMANGGSCVADPTGSWVIEPAGPEEQLLVADLDHTLVRRERHNFDPSGHYSRPDIVRLQLNSNRQSVLADSSDSDCGRR